MEEFLKKVFDLALQVVLCEINRGKPVIRWREPEYLLRLLDSNLFRGRGLSNEELIEDLRNVIRFSVKIGHPHFVNQLYSGVDPYGFAGEVIADALNPSVYTYEVAPVFTLMENIILSAMCQLVGFEHGDGIFCPGGSFSNGFGINLARYHFQPNIKKEGMSSNRIVMFASEDAHYSVYKMASFLGLGENNVISIKTDEFGKMRPDDLLLEIDRVEKSGFIPFLVFATAGTTVLGAVDPLRTLADICEERRLWLHVDAAWGGGLLFSNQHKHLLNGIARADSVTWNPHKLLGVPQQCSVLLIKHSDLLLSCHRRDADYLFQKDKFYDTSYDVGDKYLQCGRRADVLKFWLMWKAKGLDGMAEHVDHLMDLSRYFLKQVKSKHHFELVAEPEFINICFWFVPDRLRSRKTHPDYLQMLHKIAPKIKEGMLLRGSMMVNYQPLRCWPNFFRFVVQNSNVTRDDIDFFIAEIERLGSQL